MVPTYQRAARKLPVRTIRKQKRRVPSLEVQRYRGLSGGDVVPNGCSGNNVTSSHWTHVAIIRVPGTKHDKPQKNLLIGKDLVAVRQRCGTRRAPFKTENRRYCWDKLNCEAPRRGLCPRSDRPYHPLFTFVDNRRDQSAENTPHDCGGGHECSGAGKAPKRRPPATVPATVPSSWDSQKSANFRIMSGEPGRTRTCNPLIKSQLLYH
jgi:hypothetical protein